LDGTTDFSVLQNELKGTSNRLVMVAFDLLYLNGQDLRRLPLFERKSILQKLIAKTAIQFSESFEIDGGEMLKHACRTGLEGVVSKVRDSRYPSDRTNDWVKVTCAQRETRPSRASRWTAASGTASMSAAKRLAGSSTPARSTTASPRSWKRTCARLKPLIRKTQPYAKKIADRGIWVEPSLLAEVEYRAKSAEGKVRHPVFKGLREDML
jgi:bifunctional non-homologous end joining protein LigD